jgi:hypothetical protein
MIEVRTKKDLRERPADSLNQAGLETISQDLRELLLANPMTNGDDGEPVQILGVKERQVIGRMNLLCGQICVEGHNVPILWGSGFAVPPEHRPTGVGLMILLRMQGLPYTVGAVGASQMAAPLYNKLKWIDLVAPRFVLLRRARPVLERYLGAGFLSRVASAVGDVGLRALGHGFAMMTRLATRGLRVEALDRMPEELDPQLRRIDKPAFCPRSVAWLNWILTARGGSPALWLVRDRQGRPAGYFVITHRRHDEGGGGKWRNFVLGSVKDWMTFDPLAVTDAQLVRLAIDQLMRREVDAIDVCVAEPEVGNALRHCGLSRMGGMHFTFRPLPNTPLAKDQYHHLDAWRFRPADGDYFLF